MAKEWYPKLVRLLPSEGFEPAKRVTIVFDSQMRGVAATDGARIRCAGRWFRDNLRGEALGAVFHELVHVVQRYGQAPRPAPGARRPPGWLVEGIADYLRWYTFEPESHGAEISARRVDSARYDDGYRPTANFLNWASQTCATNLVPGLNAAIRSGKYSDGIWKDITGRNLQELAEAWKAALELKARKHD
jgi:hypothetical protein